MAETLKELQKKIEELEKKAAEAESPKKIGKRKAWVYYNYLFLKMY